MKKSIEEKIINALINKKHHRLSILLNQFKGSYSTKIVLLYIIEYNLDISEIINLLDIGHEREKNEGF